MGRIRTSPRVAFCAVVLVALLGPLAFSGTAGAGSSARTDRFVERLLGTNEVPPADLDGRGIARVEIDAEAGEACFKVTFDRTGTPNRGHIHTGAAGVNGGIVVSLFELVGMPTDPLNDELERGRGTGCVTADPAVLADIVANPELYYVNLHNARFPGGAVRCQLLED
ncbi:MAG: CHRD domain-containing protein [Acidimicrobiales bacterium]